MNSELDFRQYTLDELYQSAASINREKHPERAKHIDDLIRQKENQPLRRNDYQKRYDHHEPQTIRDNHLPDTTYPVKFTGTTSEYFRIWIVNVFLTIITLYIYSAWAKVRTKRYFYANTAIDGSSFEYHAKGSQLVAGRLIAAALLITYTFFQGINATISAIALGLFAVMFPWAIWRSLRFNSRASSFRNIRFGFDGQASPPYLNILIIPLIIVGIAALMAYVFIQTDGNINFDQLSQLSPGIINIIAPVLLAATLLILVLVVPALHKNLISYSINNHRYGTASFSAKIKTGRIYGIHGVTLMLSLMAFAVIAALAYALVRLFFQPSGVLDNSDVFTQLEPYADIISAAAIYLIAIPVAGIAVAFFRSRIRNHRYNATMIDSRVLLNSTVSMWSLWWLNISNLAILILSLGLGYPFTKIRSARYFAKHTTVTVAGGLDSFTERERTKLHAMGEEMADAFDVGFDIGV